MKLIDNKGRLFGKLNLIDLLVILLVLAVAAFAILRFTGRGQSSDATVSFDQEDANALEYTVLCRVVNRNLLPTLKQEVGKQLMSNGNMVDDCRILSVEESPCMERVVIEDGSVMAVENEEYCDVTFTIGGSAPFSDNAYHVGSQEVRVGKSHIVKTLTIELTGTVITMDGAALALEATNG